MAANDKISVTVPKQTITIDYVITTQTYTVFNARTFTYTAFNATTKANLLTAAANVDKIDPAQTFMFNTQVIFDNLPSTDDLNQAAQDVSDGIADLPVVNGGGYTVGRDGSQAAYVLLGEDRIEIGFNPLDPAAALEGVGDLIAETLLP